MTQSAAAIFKIPTKSQSRVGKSGIEGMLVIGPGQRPTPRNGQVRSELIRIDLDDWRGAFGFTRKCDRE
jgi:hypothetical protein